MTTKKPTATADEEWKARRGPDPAIGPGGIPLAPRRPGESPLGMLPDASPPEPPARGVTITVVGTGEPAQLLPEPCPDRLHVWFTVDRRDYRAGPVGRDTMPTGRLETGDLVILHRLNGRNGERLTYHVATPDDRAAHLAELTRAAWTAAHPLEGPWSYVPDVPLMVVDVRDVGELLEHWRRMSIRPVRLGAGVTLTHPAARPTATNLGEQWHVRPGDPDRDLAERWAPLLVARLGGPRVPCAIEGCGADAAVMLTGRVAICRPHLDTPVGQALPKRGGLRAAAASVTAALVRV